MSTLATGGTWPAVAGFFATFITCVLLVAVKTLHRRFSMDSSFDGVRSIVGGGHIRIVEDNCESLGAEYKGRQAGTFGVMGSFSSFFSHHISTVEGGRNATYVDKHGLFVGNHQYDISGTIAALRYALD